MVNIRSEEEIKKIAFSCQIVADTLTMLEKFIKPGQSIQNWSKKAENFILSKGARPAFKGYMGFLLPYVLCGSLLNGIPSPTHLEKDKLLGLIVEQKRMDIMIMRSHFRLIKFQMEKKLLDVTKESYIWA